MTTPAPPPPLPPASGTFDFARAFRVAFDDPDWVKKLLLGGLFTLLSMLIVGLFFVSGYLVRLIRNAARGDARPLPDWDDLGGLFEDGLAPFGAYLVYAVGAGLVPASLGCVLGFAGGGLAAAFGGGGGDLQEGAAVLGMVAFYVLVMVFSLALMLFFPAVLVRVALENRFGAAFDFGAIWAFIRRNVGNYLLALVAYLLASILSQFGIILFCVGIFPAVFWSYVVLGWGLGETARLDPGV